MEFRNAVSHDDLARALAIDAAHLGSAERAAYIAATAEAGGLSVAAVKGEVRAFCCLDRRYFFGKPFISMLIVSPEARRAGLGAGLLLHAARAHTQVWTSTNRSNVAMRTLLKASAWIYCGEVSGLDADDPERFYRSV